MVQMSTHITNRMKKWYITWQEIVPRDILSFRSDKGGQSNVIIVCSDCYVTVLIWVKHCIGVYCTADISFSIRKCMFPNLSCVFCIQYSTFCLLGLAKTWKTNFFENPFDADNGAKLPMFWFLVQWKRCCELCTNSAGEKKPLEHKYVFWKSGMTIINNFKSKQKFDLNFIINLSMSNSAWSRAASFWGPYLRSHPLLKCSAIASVTDQRWAVCL